MQIVFATHNQGKVIEMKQILAGFNADIVSADEAGVTDDVVEDGTTFAENAIKKARFVAEKTGKWAIADDSGICIEALGGAPGVQTARWAGEGVTGDELVQFTLKKMVDVPESNRQASFHSVVALVGPKGETWTFEGSIDGKIGLTPVGVHRPKLPYDVVFIPKGDTRTFAQMSDSEKNAMSHRGLAFQKFREFLESNILNFDK